MDDLDFTSGKVTSHYHSANLAAKTRTLTVISVIGLVVAGIAVIVEHRFWWLTLTGRRATAQVYARDEEIVGWISSRRTAWKEYPLIQTEFQFEYVDHTGADRRGSFSLPEASHAYEVGDKLDVMYPRFGSGAGEPSEWSYYFQHDSVWFSFTSVGFGCLLVAGACLWWRRRLAAPAISPPTPD